MKSATLLTVSFFLFSFITNLPLIFSKGAEQVLDTNGNPIFPGSRVYIMPAIFGAAGGGVRLGQTGNSTCPVTVLQDYSEVVTGLSVKFTILADVSTGIIFTGTELEIEFEEKPACASSSKWVVVVDDFPGGAWVGIGGDEDHQGKQVLSGGRFNIQKYDVAYKIVFCPEVTAPPGLCYDIGRRDNNENGRRLVLTNGDPYQVVFVDADATGTTTV
ncbi:hypothetical protein RJT34_26186 [Clitoria ternatea]|uniref:Uncharacterized protein n=1 Tax=Clitoria ternatea TaxID=43366 RepID=A0AAN9IBE8_CLITE